MVHIRTIQCNTKATTCQNNQFQLVSAKYAQKNEKKLKYIQLSKYIIINEI